MYGRGDYPINYRVNNTREKISYFFTSIWYRQSAADTSLAFRAIRSDWGMNGEAFTILNPRSFVENFCGLWLLKHWKISIAYRQWYSNFPNRGRKPKYGKKNRKIRYSIALVMAFLSAENENRQLKDLPLDNFGRVPEIFLLSVRTKSIAENFVYWILRPLFVFVALHRFFQLEPERFFFGICQSFYFHSLIKLNSC